MKTNTKVNFIYNSIYQLLLIILPLLTAPYVSRILGAEGVGIYAYTYSIAGYFVLFEMLGVKNYGNRSCARVQGDKGELGKTFVNIYALQIIVSVILMITYLIYSICFSKYRNEAIFQILYVLSGAIDISWFFFGIEKFKTTAIRSTIIKIISVVLIFTLVKDKNDVPIYILIIGGSALINQIVLWPFLKNEIILCSPTFSEIKKHIVPNLVLFIPVVAVSLYKIMDKIMIGNISTMVETGIYENSEKIIGIPMSLITSLGTVMLPRMSNLIANKEYDESKRLMSKSMYFVVMMGSAMAFGIASIAKSFAVMFYGEEFAGCGIVTLTLAPTILFICWANVIRTQYLLPSGMDKPYIVTVFSGAIVNLFTNFFLIPRLGAFGAALGTLAAEITVCVLQTLYVRKSLPINEYLKSGVPFIIIGLIMYIAVKLIDSTLSINNLIISILIQILVGGMVYVICTVCYLYKNNKEFLTSLVNLKK